MKVDITGMRFNSEGNPDWGAEKGEQYFVLELGKVTQLEKIGNIHQNKELIER